MGNSLSQNRMLVLLKHKKELQQEVVMAKPIPEALDEAYQKFNAAYEALIREEAACIYSSK